MNVNKGYAANAMTKFSLGFLSFSQKLFLSVVFLFLSYAVCFILFQYQREKSFKSELLNMQLQNYNNQVCDFISDNKGFTSETHPFISRRNSDIIYYDVSDPGASVSPIGAGRYTLQFTIPAVGDFGAHNVTLEFEIFQKNIKSTIPDSIVEKYDGTDQLGALEGAYEGLISVEENLLRWTFYDGDPSNGGRVIEELVDATGSSGKTIYYILEAGPNYTTDCGSFTITINPAVLTITVGGDFEYDYTGKQISGLDLSVSEYKGLVESEDEVVIEFSAPDNAIDCGTYDFIYATSNTNYTLELASNSPSQFEIVQIELSEEYIHFTTYRDSLDWYKYDGSSHSAFYDYYVDLDDSYPDKGDAFQWKVTISDEESVEIKDAGKYTIHYQITSKNFKTFSSDVEVVIEPKALTVTVGEYDVIYGEPFGDSDICPVYEGFIASENQTSLNWQTELSYDYTQGENVTIGSKPIKLTISGMDAEGVLGNYDISINDGSLNVIQRQIAVTLHPSSSEYGMAAGEIAENYLYNSQYYTVSGTNVSIPFATSDDIKSVLKLYIMADDTVVPDARLYNILYEPLNSNYSVNVTTSTHTIDPKPLGASFDATGLIYNGKEQDLSITYDSGTQVPEGFECHLEFWPVGGSEDESVRYLKDAGKYNVKVVIDNNTNYTPSFGDLSMVIEMRPADISIGNNDLGISGSGEEYDGNTHHVDGLTGNVTALGQEYKASSLLKVVSQIYTLNGNEISGHPIDAGEYQVELRIESTDQNFKAPDAPFTFSFSIASKKIDAVWSEDPLVYRGSSYDSSDLVELKDGDTTIRYYVNVQSVGGTGESEFKDAGQYQLTVSSANGNYVVSDDTYVKTYVIQELDVNVTIKQLTERVFGLTRGSMDGLSFGITGVGDDYQLFMDEYSKHNVDYEIAWNSLDYTRIVETDYVTAQTYFGVVSVRYTGDNFTLVADSADLTISPRTVTVTLKSQSSLMPDPIIQSRPSVDYVVSGTSLNGTYFGITVVHGENFVKYDDIAEAGEYPLTITHTPTSNYVFKVNDDATITVGPSINGWSDTSAGMGNNSWVYNMYSIQDDPVNWPVPNYGYVTAKIYNDDKKLEFTSDNVPIDEINNLDAGTYYLTFRVDRVPNSHNSYDYTSLAETAPITITVLKLPKESPIWSDEYFVYNSEDQTVTLVGYDSSWMVLGSIDADHPYVDDEGTITMTASDVGVYGITVTIQNRNYCWADNHGDVIDVTWEIGIQGDLKWDVEPEISSSWVFGDQPEILEAGTAQGEVKVEYCHLNGAPCDGLPKDVGHYYMRAYVEPTENTRGLEAKLYFEITPRTLETPSLGSMKVLDFDEGNEVTYDVTSEEWFIEAGLEEYVSVSGNVASEPGTHTAVLYIVEPGNCVWNGGGTEPLTVKWQITDGGLIQSEWFSVDSSSSTYTGELITKVVESSLREGEDYLVSYIDNVERGTAKIIITGIGAYSGQATYEFQIVSASEQPEFYNEQLKMYVEDSSFYNALQLPSYIDEGLLTYTSSDPSIATVDPHTGAITMNATGTVTITASYPSTANYAAGSATYELTVSDTPVEVVDHVVYIRVPVTDPDDPDDPIDDKPDEPAIVYQNDNTLYIILLLVLAAVCICFAAYIMYTHRKENQGGGQR